MPLEGNVVVSFKLPTPPPSPMHDPNLTLAKNHVTPATYTPAES